MRVARRLWRLASVAVPFVVVLEVATRIDQAISYGAPLIGAYTYESALFEYDEYGKKGRAHGRYEKWSLNALGLRGPETTIEPAEGVLRVVTLGASETFGLFESPGMEWPRQLEANLQSGGLNAEVVNGALVGMTFRRRIEHFEHRLLSLKPDIVLLVLEYPSYVDLSLREERGWPPASPAPPAKPRPQIRIVRKLKDSLLPRLPSPIGTWVQDRLTDIRVMRLQLALAESFGAITDVSDWQLDQYGSDLRQFLQLARQYEVEVILLAPVVRTDAGTQRVFEGNFPYINLAWLREAQGRFLEATVPIAAEAGVLMVDLDAVFGPEKPEVVLDTFHFSDEGARAVAQAAADGIRSLPQLDTGPHLDQPR